MGSYASVPIDVGTGPGGTDGDDTRSAFEKVKADLAQIFASFGFDSTTNQVAINTTGAAASAAKTFLHIKADFSADESQIAMQDAGSTIFHLGVDADTGFYIETGASLTVSTRRLTMDGNGNILIGGTVPGNASQGNINLFNGTPPTAGPVNGTILYSEDVAASSELKVMDEANNITVLSPHNFDAIPEGPSEEMAWSYYSERDGKGISVDMLKAIRIIEKLSGEKLVHEFER